MDFDSTRLRQGEVIVGTSALVLLASMLFLRWYGVSPRLSPGTGASKSLTGWDALPTLRWLMLLTIALALALVYFQATRRAPAVPVSLSVIVTTVGIVNALALLYRVVINEPGSDSLVQQKLGAFVGLAGALAIVYGAFRSMRQEGIRDEDGPREIETVRLPSAG